jgi:hypothetical protein
MARNDGRERARKRLGGMQLENPVAVTAEEIYRLGKALEEARTAYGKAADNWNGAVLAYNRAINDYQNRRDQK